MWRRYSSGEREIFYFAQDARSDIRAQGLGSYELDPATKKVFEQGCNPRSA